MANRQTEEKITALYERLSRKKKSLRSMSACPVTMTSRVTRTPF